MYTSITYEKEACGLNSGHLNNVTKWGHRPKMGQIVVEEWIQEKYFLPEKEIEGVFFWYCNTFLKPDIIILFYSNAERKLDIHWFCPMTA